MKKYRIKWMEIHEEDIWAEDEDQALNFAEINSGAKTYLSCSVRDVEILKEENIPDDMDAAHYHKENA